MGLQASLSGACLFHTPRLATNIQWRPTGARLCAPPVRGLLGPRAGGCWASRRPFHETLTACNDDRRPCKLRSAPHRFSPVPPGRCLQCSMSGCCSVTPLACGDAGESVYGSLRKLMPSPAAAAAAGTLQPRDAQSCPSSSCTVSRRRVIPRSKLEAVSKHGLGYAWASFWLPAWGDCCIADPAASPVGEMRLVPDVAGGRFLTCSRLCLWVVPLVLPVSLCGKEAARA